MELGEEQERQIKTIKSDMTCPFEFRCEKGGFAGYPKVREVSTLLECSQEDAALCGHSMSFGNTHFCQCPLNNYIHKECSGPINSE